MSDIKKIAIIPARSGSKGLPDKNILMLANKPLIAYTIEAAIESDLFERVIVTTDSLKYAKIAEKYGAEVIIRDESLASDSATSYMVIQDVLNKVPNYNYFVLLQPTSPFRNYTHIRKAVKQFEHSKESNFLVSVSKSELTPELINIIGDDLSLRNFDLDYSNYRRQNYNYFKPNGAIFIGRNSAYLSKKHFFGSDSIAFFMNKEDSIDIDDIIDFEQAISIQNKKNKREILRNNILERIAQKKIIMNNVKPITLIGHSIIDNWNISHINKMNVNNFGISGINTEEYYNFILNTKESIALGDNVILMSGTNDMVLDNWNHNYTLYWLDKTLNKIKEINSQARVYLIETPPVRGRMDRNNGIIKELNKSLKHHLCNKIHFIELSSDFYDEFGDLPNEFTTDGLHFTKKAYFYLEQVVSEYIK